MKIIRVLQSGKQERRWMHIFLEQRQKTEDF